MKIVINRCYGGFGLSHEAHMRYAELKGITLYPEKGEFGLTHYYTVPKEQRTPKLPGNWMSHSLEARQAYNEAASKESLYGRDISRDDPALVQVVEELGKNAESDHAELHVVEIPDDIEWQIEEYDGKEWVAEAHRTWS